LFLWNEGALREIGNALGKFILIDPSTFESFVRKMGKILVGIDVHDGLPKAIDIEWCGHLIIQRMDYMGIPFRCSWCRGTGHLRRDCSGIKVEEKSKEDDIQEDPPKYVIVVDFLGSGPSFLDSEPALSPEEPDTLIGTLKFFCPLFFKSLSLWERDALENYSWF